MYFVGLGYVSSFGMYNLTLGTTWWRLLNSPVIVQKSFFASSSSRVECSSILDGVYHSSELPRRTSRSSPRSGRSRVNVDVLRRCPLPKILTVPSATWKMKFPLLCGVNTSFALSLSGVEFRCVHLLQFFHVRDHNVSFPDSSREKMPNWCSRDLSFAEIGWYSTIAPNGITGPLKGIPNRLSCGVFPSDKRSWMFRR